MHDAGATTTAGDPRRRDPGAAALCAPAAPRPRGGAQASIIGGDPATIAEFPSLAYIEAADQRSSGFACTGTVISPRVILTAAHCVEDLDTGGIHAAGRLHGRDRRRQPAPGKTARTSSRSPPPTSSPASTPASSAATPRLLILAAPDRRAAARARRRAPTPPSTSAARRVRLAGWGLTAPTPRQAPASLRTTSTVVQDASLLQAARRGASTPPTRPPSRSARSTPHERRPAAASATAAARRSASRPDGTPVEIGDRQHRRPRLQPQAPEHLHPRRPRLHLGRRNGSPRPKPARPPPGRRPGAPLPPMTGSRPAKSSRSAPCTPAFGELFTRRAESPAAAAGPADAGSAAKSPALSPARSTPAIVSAVLRPRSRRRRLGQPLPGPLGRDTLPRQRTQRPRLPRSTRNAANRVQPTR